MGILLRQHPGGEWLRAGLQGVRRRINSRRPALGSFAISAFRTRWIRQNVASVWFCRTDSPWTMNGHIGVEVNIAIASILAAASLAAIPLAYRRWCRADLD